MIAYLQMARLTATALIKQHRVRIVHADRQTLIAWLEGKQAAGMMGKDCGAAEDQDPIVEAISI